MSTPFIPRIERANTVNRGFTAEEIRGFIADTQKRKLEPGYEAREQRRREVAERESRGLGTKFPSLIKSDTASVCAPMANAARIMLDLLK